MRVFSRSSRSIVRQRRRHRDRQAPGDAVARQAAEDVEQRQVRGHGRLVEPVLLEVIAMLGVADEGQVRVQHQRQIAGGRASLALRRRLADGDELPPNGEAGRAGRPPSASVPRGSSRRRAGGRRDAALVVLGAAAHDHERLALPAARAHRHDLHPLDRPRLRLGRRHAHQRRVGDRREVAFARQAGRRRRAGARPASATAGSAARGSTAGRRPRCGGRRLRASAPS